MASLRLLPQISRRALATHRGAWRPVALAALVSIIPAAALQGVFDALAERAGDDDVVVFLLLTTASVGAGAFGYFFLNGLIAAIVLERRAGEAPPPVLETIRTLPLGQLLVADAVLSLAIALGLELAVIPGLVIGTWYGLAPALIETRHLGAIPALRRSRALVRGNFAGVLALLLVALGVVPAVATGLEQLLEGPGPDLKELQSGLAFLLSALVFKPLAALITVELAVELDAGDRA